MVSRLYKCPQSVMWGRSTTPTSTVHIPAFAMPEELFTLSTDARVVCLSSHSRRDENLVAQHWLDSEWILKITFSVFLDFRILDGSRLPLPNWNVPTVEIAVLLVPKNRDTYKLIRWLIDWVVVSFTSHSTQNMSFRRRFSKPISWLGIEKN